MESFGRYELHEQLGHGGMGVVYRAHDTVLQRIVALKLVAASYVDDPEMRERFFREARAAAQLTHKNIVTVYDLGEHEGRPYLAMEYLAGEDLQRRLSRPEKMPLARRLEVATEFCQGVEHAHEHGIVHRDLKPANIFLADNGGVKILDFGLARPMASQLTQSNMLMGTINYMAPEQVRGERADQRSDIFSLGVVLYELFGGRRAFEGDSVASTLYKILQDVPEPLSSVDAEIPPSLAQVVERALAKNREERYQNVAAVVSDLREAVSPSPLSLPGASHGTLITPATRVESAVRPPSTPSQPAPSTSEGPLPSAPPQRSRLVPILVGALVVAAAATAWMASRRAAPVPESAQTTSTAPAPAPPAQTAVPNSPAVTPREAPTAPLETGGQKASASEAAAVAAARQQAETARGRMTEGRTAAEAAGAPEKAADAFRNASRRAQDAERLFKAQKFDAAASRYYEASGLFRDAEAAARAATQAQHPNPPSQPTSQRPQQGAASAPATAVIIPPPSSPPVTAPVSPQPVPSTTPPAAPPVVPHAEPSPPAAPQGPTDEQRITELLNRYREALESRSIDRLKQIWPSLSGSAESALRDEFQHASRISVEISSPQISVNGNTGRVVFDRHYSLVTVDGQRPQSSSQVTMDLRRAGSSWLIESVRFSPR
ncbi:MAG TPA: protein kinase [Vicinamibacterales bacterium]|jgi:serine/threonine protein kinase|nr:protein kinase [Vicinamibacterales bacterium]